MLKETGMAGIRTATVRDQVTGHATGIRIEQEKSILARGASEVGDTDDVTMDDLRTVPVESSASARDNTWVDDRVHHHSGSSGDSKRRRRRRKNRTILSNGGDQRG